MTDQPEDDICCRVALLEQRLAATAERVAEDRKVNLKARTNLHQRITGERADRMAAEKAEIIRRRWTIGIIITVSFAVVGLLINAAGSL